MLTIWTEKHKLHDPRGELYGGQLVEPFECPRRVDMILDRLRKAGLGPCRAADSHSFESIFRVHDPDYLAFLETCWADWHAAGYQGDAIASKWPARRMQSRIPDHIDGRLGYYALAAETAITEGTYEAARASADCALTATAEIVAGRPSAFALCRPPGHHAARDLFGGYCFINNAAVAAQAFLDAGAKRVAILDIDFHHGNGTQDIFYRRDDVAFLSIHGRPQDAFPFFLGYADERGVGDGEGYNHNFPLEPAASYAEWGNALAKAIARISEYAPDALVISLGVDTFKDDPISFFALESDDFLRCGEAIATLRQPTLFVMEGGYAVADIGRNVVNVLQGFAGRSG